MNRYWVGGTGNCNDTSHWSASSGGSGGASVPTSNDDVFIDIGFLYLADGVVVAGIEQAGVVVYDRHLAEGTDHKEVGESFPDEGFADALVLGRL